MTIDEIQELVVSASPQARHYFSIDTNKPYTFWEETRRLPLMSDDFHEEAWAFYVHRFTNIAHDQEAQLILRTLEADPRVTVSYSSDYDHESGYIHHIYACEGV